MYACFWLTILDNINLESYDRNWQFMKISELGIRSFDLKLDKLSSIFKKEATVSDLLSPLFKKSDRERIDLVALKKRVHVIKSLSSLYKRATVSKSLSIDSLKNPIFFVGFWQCFLLCMPTEQIVPVALCSVVLY